MLLRRPSYLHLELRSAAVMLLGEESVEVRLASPEAVILRLMSSLLCEHYPDCTCHNRSAFARFAIEVTPDQKSWRSPPVNEINSISTIFLYLSLQKATAIYPRNLPEGVESQ